MVQLKMRKHTMGSVEVSKETGSVFEINKKHQFSSVYIGPSQHAQGRVSSRQKYLI